MFGAKSGKVQAVVSENETPDLQILSRKGRRLFRQGVGKSGGLLKVAVSSEAQDFLFGVGREARHYKNW